MIASQSFGLLDRDRADDLPGAVGGVRRHGDLVAVRDALTREQVVGRVGVLGDRPVPGAGEGRDRRLGDGQVLADADGDRLGVGLLGLVDHGRVGVVRAGARHALLVERVGELERASVVVAGAQGHRVAADRSCHPSTVMVRLVSPFRRERDIRFTGGSAVRGEVRLPCPRWPWRCSCRCRPAGWRRCSCSSA